MSEGLIITYVIATCLAACILAIFSDASRTTRENNRFYARMWLTLPFWPVWVIVFIGSVIAELWKTADWNPKK